MKTVEKFFGIQVNETQVCNGFQFHCVKKAVLNQGAAPTLFGTLTTPTGEVVDYTVKGVFANKLNKIAGVANKVTFKAKVDNSQQTGENKVVSVSLSATKAQKRFLKAYKLCKQASEMYGLTDVFTPMLEALQQLDKFTIHIEQVKAQQAIEQAKAEAAAKAEAEAAAQKLQKAINELRTMKENFMNCGMSAAQAEMFVKQNPNYTDEEKAAAFE